MEGELLSRRPLVVCVCVPVGFSRQLHAVVRLGKHPYGTVLYLW